MLRYEAEPRNEDDTLRSTWIPASRDCQLFPSFRCLFFVDVFYGVDLNPHYFAGLFQQEVQ
jgi:hypothetical protein